MTYTFGLHWVRPMTIVWDFGPGGDAFVACAFPVCGCYRFCRQPVFATGRRLPDA